MTTKISKFIYVAFSFLVSLGIALSTLQAAQSSDSDPGFFKVASLKTLKMDSKTQLKLSNAYKAQFGKTPCQVKLIPGGKNGTYLWFESCDKGGQTFGIQLSSKENFFGINFGQPLGINNCNTTSSCTKCKVGCGCARDSGEGSCDQVVTQKIFGDAFPQMEASLR